LAVGEVLSISQLSGWLPQIEQAVAAHQAKESGGSAEQQKEDADAKKEVAEGEAVLTEQTSEAESLLKGFQEILATKVKIFNTPSLALPAVNHTVGGGAALPASGMGGFRPLQAHQIPPAVIGGFKTLPAPSGLKAPPPLPPHPSAPPYGSFETPSVMIGQPPPLAVTVGILGAAPPPAPMAAAPPVGATASAWEAFQQYPPTGAPFPPLPAGWTVHMSASRGIYYYKDKDGSTSYRHPENKEKYFFSPQAFLDGRSEEEVQAFIRAERVRVGDPFLRWRRDQRTRLRFADQSVLGHFGISYDGKPAEKEGKKDETRPDQGASKKSRKE
jgi:hypothetical protein